MLSRKRKSFTLDAFHTRLAISGERPPGISPARWYAMLRQYDKWRLDRDRMTMEELIAEWESEEE